MAIVLGLVVGAGWVARRFYSRLHLGRGPRRLAAVRQAISLGGKRQIVLLEVGSSVLVVGAAGDSMRLLAKIPKADCEAGVEEPAAKPGFPLFDKFINDAQARHNASPEGMQQ